MKFLSFTLALLVSAPVLAQSGADILLETTGNAEEVAADTTPAAATVDTGLQKIKLTDAVLQAIFVEWRAAGAQSFEVNHWITKILSHEFAQAAHLWSSVQTHLPESLRPTAAVAWAYLNWRMDLPQTFVNSWREARMRANGTRPWLALEQMLAQEKSSEWVAKNQPYIDPAFASDLITNAKQGFELELAAWAARYNMDAAADMLVKLPMGHPVAMELAKTAVLNHARKRELGEAGKILKRRVEPELKKRGDAKQLAFHYLTLGRLLYQAGSLEAAEAFYAQVPRGVAEFIPARAERTWALLRLGRVSELRGELESLTHATLKDRFLPEVSLVRSVSNLKLCRYDDVARDFEFFIQNNQKWVQKIETALKTEDAPAPDMRDGRFDALTQSIKIRQAEDKKLAKLTKDSIKAALPAVGEQPHWVNARMTIAEAVEADKRSMKAEKMRFWKNREIVLTEAIRKMKFVRVEAMSQVRMAADSNSGSSDVVSNIQSKAEGKQSYKFDGVYWPDEMFKLHAKAQTRCGGGKNP